MLLILDKKDVVIKTAPAPFPESGFLSSGPDKKFPKQLIIKNNECNKSIKIIKCFYLNF